MCCGDDDVFVHVSNLEAGGATLADGQTVEFEVGHGRKREEAKHAAVSRLTPRNRRIVSAAPVGSWATGHERHSLFEPRAR